MYVVSFTKYGLRMYMNIIPTMLNEFRVNAVESDQDVHCTCKLMSLTWNYIVGLKLTWTWITFEAVMISIPERLFKVVIAYCIDQTGRLTSPGDLNRSLCHDAVFSSFSWFLPKESEGDSIDCSTQCSLKWSFLRLPFFKFHFSLFAELPNYDSLAQNLRYMYVLTENEKVNRLSSHLLNVAVIGKIKEFRPGTSCMGT